MLNDQVKSQLKDLKKSNPWCLQEFIFDADDYEELRSSLEKLQLNDASLSYNRIVNGWALDFARILGLLHKIIQERLDVSLIWM